jgi:WD40 repeat protein
MDVSPNEKWIVYYEDNTLYSFDIKNSNLKSSLVFSATCGEPDIRFSINDEWFAIGGLEFKTSIITSITLDIIDIFPIRLMDVSKTTSKILGVDSNYNAVVYDVITGEIVSNFTIPEGRLITLSMVNDIPFCIIENMDLSYEIFNLSNKQVINKFSGPENFDIMKRLFWAVISPTGEYLLTGDSQDGNKVVLWDIKKSVKIDRWSGSWYSGYAEFSIDGRRILFSHRPYGSENFNGSIHVFDSIDMKSIFTENISNYFPKGIFSSNGERIYLINEDMKINIIDLGSSVAKDADKYK